MSTLFLDPRIRDNVFLPIIALMTIVTLLRFFITKLMNTPDNPLLHPASVSYNSLKNTIFERYADLRKEPPPEEEFDIKKAFKGIKDDIKDKYFLYSSFSTALARSTKIRKSCEMLPEDSVKLRKAYFCKEEGGYFVQTRKSNQLANMMNPDMMSGMLKQNVQGMFNMMLFSVVGSIFSGFIIAKVPFPLG